MSTAPASAAAARRVGVWTRVEVWSDVPFAGGVRRADVAERDVLALGTSEGAGRTEACVLTLAAASPAAAGLAARDVLRLVDRTAADEVAGVEGAVEYWRVLSDRLTVGGGSETGRLEVTAVPLLLDWGAAGRVRDLTTTASTAASVGAIGGIFTAADVLARFALPRVAASGRGYWRLGSVPNVVALALRWEGQTPLELVRLVERTWQLEARPRLERDASGREVGMVLDVLATPATPFATSGAAGVAPTPATPLVLECAPGGRGAIERLTRTRTAADLATVVLPLGQGGATVGRAQWKVVLVNPDTGWVVLADNQLADTTGADADSGPGPIQFPAQGVGLVLRGWSGKTAPVLESAVGADLFGEGVDLTLSRVRLPAPSALLEELLAGNIICPVEFRADAAGTLLDTVEHPDAVRPPPAGLGRVEVTLDRSDIGGPENLLGDPTGYQAGGGAFGAWRLWNASGAGVPAPQLLARAPAPLGNPLGDTRDCLQVTLTDGLAVQALITPAAAAFDPAPGDDVVSGYLVLYIHDDLSEDVAQRRPASVAAGASGYTRSVLVRLVASGDAYPQASTPRPHAPAVLPGNAGAPEMRTWTGQTWVTLGVQGWRVAAGERIGIELGALPGQLLTGSTVAADPVGRGGGLRITVALAQLTRTREHAPPVIGRPAVTLWQLGNAYLAEHGAPEVGLDAAVVDRGRADPARYGDQALLLGGDVVVRASALGHDAPARIVGRAPNRRDPGETSVVLATRAQQAGLTDRVLAWLHQRGATGRAP